MFKKDMFKGQTGIKTAAANADTEYGPKGKKKRRNVGILSPTAPRKLHKTENESNPSKSGTIKIESEHTSQLLLKTENESNPSKSGTIKIESEHTSQLLNVIKGPNTQPPEMCAGQCLSDKCRSRRRKTDTKYAECDNLNLPSEIPNATSLELSDDEEERLQTHVNRGKSSVNERNRKFIKRKEISLAERMKVMAFAETFTERQTALAFGISKTAVNAIMKNKLELITLYEASKKIGTSRCRRIRSTSFEDINNKTWIWLVQRVKRKDPVTNKQLQEKALSFARLVGVRNFTASKGWLDGFKRRFGITLSRSVVSVKNINSVRAYLEVKKGRNKASGSSSDAMSSTDFKTGPFSIIRLSTEVPEPIFPKNDVEVSEDLLV